MTTDDFENQALETAKVSSLPNSQEYEQQVFQNAMTDKLSHPLTPKPQSCRSPTDDKEYETMRAVALLNREMRRCVRQFGEDHPTTLQAKMHCASGMCQVGEYEIARELWVDVVAVRQHNLGNDHPETFDAMFNLAVTMNNQAVDLRDEGELGKAARSIADELSTIGVGIRRGDDVAFELRKQPQRLVIANFEVALQQRDRWILVA